MEGKIIDELIEFHANKLQFYLKIKYFSLQQSLGSNSRSCSHLTTRESHRRRHGLIIYPHPLNMKLICINISHLITLDNF
jgi:AAA+ ATPase superfamily predicted ATPase